MRTTPEQSSFEETKSPEKTEIGSGENKGLSKVQT